MRNWICQLGLTAALAAFPLTALANGEIFKLEMTGTERCDDFDRFKFGSRNNVDLWVRIIDDQEWDIAFSPMFLENETIPVIGISYFASKSKLVFSGAQFVDQSFIAIEGTAFLDSNGGVRKATGVFQQALFIELPTDPNFDCFSSGKFKTTQKVF